MDVDEERYRVNVMPFKSEKQRRYLHANEPEIARRWENKYATGGTTMPMKDKMDEDITITRKTPSGASVTIKSPRGYHPSLPGIHVGT